MNFIDSESEPERDSDYISNICLYKVEAATVVEDENMFTKSIISEEGRFVLVARLRNAHLKKIMKLQHGMAPDTLNGWAKQISRAA